MNNQLIKQLFDNLKERKITSKDKSYTSYLVKNPKILAKKIGEESAELIIAYVNKNKSEIINESADLFYHLLVVWISVGLEPDEIWNELSKRMAKSGFEEKNSRSFKNE